ncbi:MAG: MBL fold metallo-hydrolase [Sulfobacillus benefaciens]|uniref:MBL fold metallo-hydrolase n=1 Tax=Sulfobacillus benefaciens TaxID=453960 RepID=A0A2T2XJ04_9FIRM|nr:MAG: MBL fold metallo-hydrolase [Sulfobacillus benefaciens]
MAVTEVGEDLFLVDLHEAGRPFRSSAYIIRGPEPTLIETGSSNCFTYVADGLKTLGYAPVDLKHIVVTHVHLDHAGGAGRMMEAAPYAVLHANRRATPHLIDPTRLEAGSRAVYGSALESLFGAILPVPHDRVQVQEDGSILELGNGRRLTFYDTPGHAKHHSCIWDNVTRGIFSGDMVGIRYRFEGVGDNVIYGFPTTSPPDFDPEVMLASLDRLQAMNPNVIYHTHFGPTAPASEAFAFTRRGIFAIQQILDRLPDDATAQMAEEELRAYLSKDLEGRTHLDDLSDLALDIYLNAQGMIVYKQKKKAGKL